ncbi:MAG: DUF805 domain-containing protein [Chloroflexi bacterium]|nr:MAG: DUF805 domain-containing protein [Chloroflexota bacterium]
MNTVDDHLERLVDYVEDQLVKGVSKDAIRAVLLNNGHDTHLIDDIFAFIRDQNEPGARPTHVPAFRAEELRARANPPMFYQKYFRTERKMMQGRIDRVSFMQAYLVLYAPAIAILAVFASVTAIERSGSAIDLSLKGVIYLTILLISIIYVPILYVLRIILTARRLHDFNVRGIWSLLSLVGGINFALLVLSCLMPGSKSDNKFGPPQRVTDPFRALGLKK